MGPGPKTTTMSPGSISVNSTTACGAHVNGSVSAPTSESRSSSRGKTTSQRTEQYFANPPLCSFLPATPSPSQRRLRCSCRKCILTEVTRDIRQWLDLFQV